MQHISAIDAFWCCQHPLLIAPPYTSATAECPTLPSRLLGAWSESAAPLSFECMEETIGPMQRGLHETHTTSAKAYHSDNRTEERLSYGVDGLVLILNTFHAVMANNASMWRCKRKPSWLNECLFLSKDSYKTFCVPLCAAAKCQDTSPLLVTSVMGDSHIISRNPERGWRRGLILKHTGKRRLHEFV